MLTGSGLGEEGGVGWLVSEMLIPVSVWRTWHVAKGLWHVSPYQVPRVYKVF